MSGSKVCSSCPSERITALKPLLWTNQAESMQVRVKVLLCA
jgi:hypothetical protein